MSKKIFVFALLAVFVLTQFSIASAAVVDGDITVAPIPTFSKNGDTIALEWSVTGMPATGNQYVNFWWTATGIPVWICSAGGPVNATTLTSANGTYASYGALGGWPDQYVIEYLVTVDDVACPAAPSSDTPAMTSTFIDDEYLDGIYLNKPSMDWWDDASCNTFEIYALMSDSDNVVPDGGFSGFGAWNQHTTGTFAPPAPEGPETAELSWVFTFPSTASNNWQIWFAPEDKVGNKWGDSYFYNDTPTSDELEDCVNFTDVAGHANEVYIRYLADLGLISGFADGTFGPDNTLTRAEAATLFEKANGLEEDDVINFPTSAPAGCEFTDVAASDWFSGWVWAACEDGFMNGVGGGLFDPNNLLTRGQIVTIFNNIHNMNGGTDGFLDFGTVDTNLSDYYGDWNPPLRSAAWTDVFVGDYFAEGALESYAVGIVDGTTATTFSPNQAATRGEYAKMLYRALMKY